MNNLTKKEMIMAKVAKFKDLAMERHNLSIEDYDCLYRANRADELVWQMSGIAHVLLDMDSEMEACYPELLPFLNYLVRTYPALKGKE